MKTKILVLSFLLLGFTTSPMLGGAPDPVLDIADKKLRTGPGVEYYILPVNRGSGGGLTLASSRTRNHSCPLDVVQEKHEADNGLPLTFSPVNPKKRVVEVSTDLNVKFSGATICVQSTVWKLDLDESIGQYIVTTGGVEGNPSRETISNWFKIEIYGDDYKLVFCPTVCNTCKVLCRDIGIFIDNGTRSLALSNEPFKIMFKKAGK